MSALAEDDWDPWIVFGPDPASRTGYGPLGVASNKTEALWMKDHLDKVKGVRVHLISSSSITKDPRLP